MCAAEETVTTEQIVRIVEKYLRDNPSKLNKPAVLLIMRALMDAFPCHQQK